MAANDPRINVVMPPDLYERFQRHLFEAGRRKKGAISEAVCEAVEAWLQE